MLTRACVALALLASVLLVGLSSAAHAETESPVGASTTSAVAAEGAADDRRPPAVPQERPADVSPQSSSPETGGPTWLFAAVGAALMITGTVVTARARRGSRTRG